MAFDLGSWYQDSKCLTIFSAVGLSFVRMKWLCVGSWMAPGWGMVTRKTEPWLKAWNFQPFSPFSREGRGSENGVSNWLCLCDETSVKIPKVWTLESFQVGQHVEVLGEWWTHIGNEGFLPLPLPYAYFPPRCSFVSFIISFYYKLINIK